MFKAVKIYRYRCCVDVALQDLPFTTALVGRNGAGKTSVLRAIDWISAVGAGRFGTVAMTDFEDRDVYVEVMRGAVRFEFRVTVEKRKVLVEDSLSQMVHLTESIKWYRGDREEGWVRRSGTKLELSWYGVELIIDQNTYVVPFILALFPGEQTAQVAELKDFLAGVKYYGLDELQYVEPEGHTLVWADRYESWRSRNTLTGSSDVALKLIHLSQDCGQEFRELKESLGQNGLGLVSDILIRKREAKAASGIPEFYLVSFVIPGYVEQSFSLDQLSAGTRRVLNLMTAMIHDESSVMLIEHPEDSVHDELLFKLIGLIKANTNPSQVVFTSHSATALNTLELNEVRLVSVADGKCDVRSLTNLERDAACQFMAEEGTFADFLEAVQD